MRLLNEFFLSLHFYYKALRFINKHRLHYMSWVAAGFNLAAFLLVGVLAYVYAASITDYLLLKMGLEDSGSRWSVGLQLIIGFTIRLIVVMLYLKLYRYVILLFFSPILTFISDKVQDIENQNPQPFRLKRFLSDMIRGSIIALINISKELVFTILFLLIGFLVPVISPLVPFAIFFVESYFFGFSMVDYRNEYFQINVSDSNKIIWKHKGFVLGNGIVFNLLLLIPLVGVLFAPSWAAVAAGLGINELENKYRIIKTE
ncbi:EI24 domain-containing protein [Xanthovirga aplysinae]|uniref:EI24 domain-containing protein n=1 Tax=Xanthovirga aplysinae TaxID=2529853 RepID=UPI0012BCDEC2|nr:EI24 domain-containing protein [Xanthovirga aplysinae]MTI31088.1 EI24 domain-containing protein [Xanthovirga aplysinae]